MNRQSLYEKIASPADNERSGTYVFRGCDASISRQLSRAFRNLATEGEDTSALEPFLREQDNQWYIDHGPRLIFMTCDQNETYISHGVVVLGEGAVAAVCMIDGCEHKEQELTGIAHGIIAAEYPRAS